MGVRPDNRLADAPMHPVACTSCRPECTTRTPMRAIELMTLDTLVSLPGMGCDERITVSWSFRVIHLLSLAAIFARADMGSPWDPVHMSTSSSSRTSPSRFASTSTPSGTLR